MCLGFNRTSNQGFPCTYDLSPTVTASEALAIESMANEVYYLRQNISQVSQIGYVANSTLPHGDLAVLLPTVGRLPANVDYRASAVGVSTQCRAISPKCKMQVLGPQNQDSIDPYTQFNCTPQFYGVLGMQPNSTQADALKAEDSNLPPMAFKPSQSLQYAFFEDSDLTIPYNTEGYNVSTGNVEPGIPTLPDSALINPVYVAVAGRISIGDESAGSNLMNDAQLFHTTYDWTDFVLNCSYTTYDLEYTWSNGAIHNTSFTPSPNGSLAEMYHGALSYFWISGGAPDLQANLVRASKEDTSESFAREWANLYSMNILSVIGAYSSPRTNLQEQERRSIIVTQVPKVPFYVLLGFSGAYVVLGLCLTYVAYRASSRDTWELANQLSLPAFVAGAFNREAGAAEAAKEEKDGDEKVLRENDVNKEDKRVRVAGDSGGWRYTVQEHVGPSK